MTCSGTGVTCGGGGTAGSCGCTPPSDATTCAGRCGSVTNACGTAVDCGPCDCDPACPVCQTCDVRTGVCIPDPAVRGDACDTCRTCDAAGECAVAPDDTPCDDGDACTANAICTSGVCGGGDAVVCPANECQIAGTCDATDGCPDPTNKTNGTACSDGDICCNGTCCTGCCGADGSCGACLVFVTSSSRSGNLGGLAGADAICQNLADTAPTPLPGTYKAWLTGDGESPATRFRRSALGYQRVDGVTVADSWADLTNGTLDNPINVTQAGATVSSTIEAVWTNTGTNGAQSTSGYDCINWTSSDFEDRGDTGNAKVTSSQWTTGFITAHCGFFSARLYCFQQE